jgi:hypothetical protein
MISTTSVTQEFVCKSGRVGRARARWVRKQKAAARLRSGRWFATADVLSVGTSFLFGKIGGVYKILNFLTGQDLYTHQLPRAVRETQDGLLAQVPWLKSPQFLTSLDSFAALPEDERRATFSSFVGMISGRFGARHFLRPCSARCRRIDPITEALSITANRAAGVSP